MITTSLIDISENKIIIKYTVDDSKNEYEYYIETSDK